MTRGGWLSVLDQAAQTGFTRVQFIGGEPTLHPALSDLVNRAVELGLSVEVFSNLMHVRESLWPVLRQRGVSLATSYYSDQADEHDRITGNGVRTDSGQCPGHPACRHHRQPGVA
ncbi:hypothetical protein GXW82_28895 [Streptacidiphilus sp. 4-A2]|nr:hypothetical protein [Streptacidiphilus sp. 4-A2]